MLWNQVLYFRVVLKVSLSSMYRCRNSISLPSEWSRIIKKPENEIFKYKRSRTEQSARTSFGSITGKSKMTQLVNEKLNLTCSAASCLPQLWCGPKPCSLHRKTRASECPAGHTCVAVPDERCFVKPCPSQGECWSPSHRAPPTARCHPGGSCANVTFTFNKDVMMRVSLVSFSPSLSDIKKRKTKTFVQQEEKSKKKKIIFHDSFTTAEGI